MTGGDRRLDTQCAAPLSFRPHCPRPVASTPGVTIEAAHREGGRGWWTRARPGRAGAGRLRRRRARAGGGGRGRGPPGHLRRLPGRGPTGWVAPPPGSAPARTWPARAPARRRAGRGPRPPRRQRRGDGPPAEAGPAAEALAAATADLDELLAGLSAEQWRLPVIHGWDVDELLRHLAAARPPAAAGRRRAAPGVRDLDPRRRPARRARAAAQPAGPRPPPRRPGHGHAAAAAGLRAAGVERSGRTVALRLEGPGGGTWTVPPPGTGRRRPP